LMFEKPNFRNANNGASRPLQSVPTNNGSERPGRTTWLRVQCV
jgi:hypothetical protein